MYPLVRGDDLDPNVCTSAAARSIYLDCPSNVLINLCELSYEVGYHLAFDWGAGT